MKLFGPVVIAAATVELATAGWELVVHNVALELAVLGAGAVGAREVYRRLIKPAWWTLRKIDAVYDAVRDLPAWRAQIDSRMAEGAEHFERIDGQLDLMARADKARISDALERRPDPPRPRPAQ